MANKVQIKRGAELGLYTVDSPQGIILSQGEFAFTTDSKKIFIGDGAVNIELAQRLGIIKTSENLYGGELGGMPYQSAASTTSMLAPNISTTRKFLSETGDGSNGNAPEWSELLTSDISGIDELGYIKSIDASNISNVVFTLGDGSTITESFGHHHSEYALVDEVNDGFIKNQYASAQTANLWIDGNAKVDTLLVGSSQTNYTYAASISAETVLWSEPISTYTSFFFDYSISDGTNARTGTIMATAIGASIEFTEVSTKDIGDTSAVSLTADIDSGNVRLNVSITSGTWDIKILTRKL